MLPRKCFAFAALTCALLLAGSARADQTDSLKKGTPEIKSAGPLAFGPDGVLFVGEPAPADVPDQPPVPLEEGGERRLLAP